MVVYNLDFKGTGIDLPEADAPRVVNPNAVFPLAITCEDLQAIAWNRSKIAQGYGWMNVVQLSLHHRSITLKLPAKLAEGHLLGLPVPE